MLNLSWETKKAVYFAAVTRTLKNEDLSRVVAGVGLWLDDQPLVF